MSARAEMIALSGGLAMAGLSCGPRMPAERSVLDASSESSTGDSSRGGDATGEGRAADGNTDGSTLSSAVVTLASVPGTAPWIIAVDSTGAYWADENHVWGVPLHGGPPTALASQQSAPYSIALDATNVYWVNEGSGTVMKASKGGGALTTLASGRTLVTAIAVEGSVVYWTGSELASVPTTGGVVTTLLSAGYPDIATDPTTIYLSGAPGVYSLPLAGGSLTTLASGVNAGGVVVDDTSVYWADNGMPARVVKRMTLGGGAPITLASMQGQAANLAVDGTSGICQRE